MTESLWTEDLDQSVDYQVRCKRAKDLFMESVNLLLKDLVTFPCSMEHVSLVAGLWHQVNEAREHIAVSNRNVAQKLRDESAWAKERAARRAAFLESVRVFNLQRALSRSGL